MALLFYKWSRTAANNATADASVNMAEGMAPSAVNDGIRALMASAAGFRDDISGAIATSGTSTAYTVTSYQVFDSLANMNGQMIAFTPHATNGATVTLNVDGLGAKPLRSAPSIELPAGVLVQGSPYIALYNSSDAVFYLHGYYTNPYSIPIAGGIDFWGTTAPNSSFAFPAGQAISRSTYSVLFGIMSTTYGVGDGSTTFNLPDKTGRVSAMKEASATRLTTAGGGVDGATMGSAAGTQNGTILQGNLPSATLTTTVTDPGHFHKSFGNNTARVYGNVGNGGSVVVGVQLNNGDDGTIVTETKTTGITASTALGGSGTAFKLIQPTIVCNYIIRII